MGRHGDKYRETPVPSPLATIRTIADVRDAPADTPLVDVSKRTIRRWVTTAADKLEEQTGDVGWQPLGAHNLRRTWATALANADGDPLLVIDWGGWFDLETFLEHYKCAFSPDAQQRERAKVIGYRSVLLIDLVIVSVRFSLVRI